MTAADEPTSHACQNCGAPLLGGHCYSCGQPEKGLVRHFGSILGDFFDSVFDLDSRLLRTVGPLLFKPGQLSLEYFAGHRVRYVSPVRLFVFFCVAAFFVLKLAVDAPEELTTVRQLEDQQTIEQVEALRQETRAAMEKDLAELGDSPGAAGLRAGIQAIDEQAQRRIEWIKARDAARAEGQPEPSAPDEVTLSFGDGAWDPATNPIHFDSLPDAANARLNAWAARGKDNIQRVQKEPALIKDAFLESLPQTLFLLLPLFALLLKLVYVFKRRLYMEHLIVALHSHAFLCVAVLLAVALSEIGDLSGAGSAGARAAHVGEIVLASWVPIYLWIMQKRVYRQGVIMTTLKFGMLGTAYLILLSLGAAFNLMFSLVTL